MPYKKNAGSSAYNKYQRGYKQGQRYRNKYSYTDKLAYDVGQLKGLINTEFKKEQLDPTAANVTTTFSRHVLNGPAAGDDWDKRDGRSIRCKSVQISGKLTRGNNDCVVRGLVVIDTQPDGALPTVNKILDAENVTALRNLNYRSRFVILKDFHWVLNNNTPDKYVKFYKKLNMKTIFKGTGAGITDITTNSLYFVIGSDEASSPPSINFTSRVRYIDN